ncbi:MAG TPA: ATP-binding protein [Sphingomonas sp.]|nr:ATP-binding protein [Sphingomonas sp.]
MTGATNAAGRTFGLGARRLRLFLLCLFLAAAGQAQAGTVQPVDRLIEQAKAEMRGSPQTTLDLADAAERQLGSSSGDRHRRLAEIRWLQGEAYLRLNNPEKAAPLIAAGLESLDGPQEISKLHGDLLLSKGGVDTARADVSAALSDYQRAFHIFRRVGEPRSQAISLQYIASLYRVSGDLKTALRYDRESGDVYKDDDGLSLSTHNNQGNSLNALGRYAEADRQYREALRLARKIASPTLVARILGNIARNDLTWGKTGEAHRTITEALNVVDDSGGEGWRRPLLAIAAGVDLERGALPEAERLITQCFSGVDLQQTTVSLRDAHETAYEIYKRLGRDDLALQHLEALKRLDDQTASLAASANTALMAARFDYTNQNLKIAKLQAQDLQRRITYERAQARTVRLAFIAAGGVTVVIIAMLVFGIVTIRRSRNEERSAKDALAETNDALARALAAKTEFLATTSHEIRTPLNGILGMTQVMLADRALPDATRERLGVVHSAGVTMRALVDDILDVAKMETGNMTIEHAPMDVCEVLRDVARVWEDQARARGLEFELALDGCPAIVVGDAARLRQVVFNLLSNALKFTEAGRITLGGSTVDCAEGRRVRIAVSDTGIGIAADKIEDVFESFRQADASTTRRFGGTGLGLAICRNLARAMGGDVHAESVLGEGTTFTIDLPLVESALAACAVERADAESSAALLIVDRNPITRSMLRALLEERAGSVAFAASLAEAAEHLAGGSIALALIDEATARAEGEGWSAALRTVVEAAGTTAGTAILWHRPEGEEAETLRVSGIGQVIAKPIAGPALRDALYPPDAPNRDDPPDSDLVSDAA